MAIMHLNIVFFFEKNICMMEVENAFICKRILFKPIVSHWICGINSTHYNMGMLLAPWKVCAYFWECLLLGSYFPTFTSIYIYYYRLWCYIPHCYALTLYAYYIHNSFEPTILIMLFFKMCIFIDDVLSA